MTHAAVIAGTLLAMAGCHARTASQDVPALLTHPTAESHAELVQVVSRALNRTTVTLADDALTHESTLVIERAPARDAQGLPLQGRETGRPVQFRLVQNGTRCVLVHDGSGRRWTLQKASCSPR